MQRLRMKIPNSASSRTIEVQQKEVLLVGNEDAIHKDHIYQVFSRSQFHVAGQSSTLLEALARLQYGVIDLVLLGCEFSKEELSLFSFDARRRGFTGLILHIISTVQEALPSINPNHLTTFHALFTPRQQAVLARVSEGWTNQQIAAHLRCSEGTVKATLQALFSKFGVRKRSQIVRMAFEQTLISPSGAGPADIRAAKTRFSGQRITTRQEKSIK